MNDGRDRMKEEDKVEDAPFRRRLGTLSLFQRIVVANTVIITLGAIGGTLLTRLLLNQVAESVLILFFVALGTTLSVAVNYALVYLALHPLYVVCKGATAAASGEAGDPPAVPPYAGHDIQDLSQALCTLVGELNARNQELSALSRRVLSVQEEERRRIARSLHDDTAQNLSTLMIQLERLERNPPGTPSALRTQMASCRQLAGETVRELRRIIHDLRPSILDDLGLVPALRSYARTTLVGSNVHLSCNLPEEIPALKPEESVALYRITQEAIHNVLAHADAQQLALRLVVDDNRLCLSIADDGKGFDPAAVSGQAVERQQLGLLGMAERAELIGATYSVDSAPGGGTRVQVCLPLATTRSREQAAGPGPQQITTGLRKIALR